MKPQTAAVPVDKSEGVYRGAFAVTDPSPFPVDEKFTFWLDDEGDYMLQLQREPGLQAHGSTPEDAVYAMRQVLDLAASLEVKAAPSAPPTEPVVESPEMEQLHGIVRELVAIKKGLDLHRHQRCHNNFAVCDCSNSVGFGN